MASSNSTSKFIYSTLWGEETPGLKGIPMGMNFYISFLVILEYKQNNTVNFILDTNEIGQTDEHRVIPAVRVCMYMANIKFEHAILPRLLPVK